MAAVAVAAIGLLTTGHASQAPNPASASSQVDDPRVLIADEPHRIAAFDLTDQASRSFTNEDLRGRTSLVFFGFTNCRNVCPVTATRLRQVARALAGEASPLTNVLISVDGDRDTPDAMSRFLTPYSPGFVGLTGKPEAVREVATDFKAVFFKGMPIDAKGGYDVEHTPQVYLVDRAGRMRATFYNASVESMVDVTRRVMREK